MRITNVILSPVIYFNSLRNREPGWLFSFGSVLLAAAASAVSVATITAKGQPMVAAALSAAGALPPEAQTPPLGLLVAFSVVSVFAWQVVLFGLQVFAFCCFYWFLAQHGRARLLVKLMGVAYWAHIPFLAFMVLSAIFYVPLPLDLPSVVRAAEVQGILNVYQSQVAAEPLNLTVRMVGMYFGLWVVALQGVALRVVSGCSSLMSWIAAIVIGGVFVVLPWALERFM